MREMSLAAVAIVVMPVSAMAADAEAGKAVFNKCKICHQIGDGAKNLIGPNLTGVIGRKAGTVDGFAYSDAMKNAGWVWDEAVFKEYIADPAKKLPGVKMLFPGLKDSADADNVYAYLKSFSK